MVVPTAFNGSMSGVCGNFDGEMANDYTLQNGTDVNGEEADMKIGNSYVDDSNKRSVSQNLLKLGVRTCNRP